jgi:ribosomal protein S15P/S13E
VTTERDSFREAMKELLVSMNSAPEAPPTISSSPARITSLAPDEPSSPPSRKKKSQEASSSSTSSSSNHSSTLENPNWQSAVSVMGSFLSGTPNQSALALTSSLLPSSKNGVNTVSTSEQNSTSSQQTIQILEMEIQKLKKYSLEIQKVEINKLKSQNEELEKSLEVAQQATLTAEQWADQEFHLLENRLEEMAREKEEVYHKLELNKIEMERLQKQINRFTSKSSTYEEKITNLNHRIENLEKELKETKLTAINPTEFTSLQNKVQELMGLYLSLSLSLSPTHTLLTSLSSQENQSIGNKRQCHYQKRCRDQ